MLTLGTAIFISHGWIIDGLVVARYGESSISALAKNGGRPKYTFIVLDPDDEVKIFKGNNSNFHGAVCCGKLEIETINGKKYGPFGLSGNPG